MTDQEYFNNYKNSFVTIFSNNHDLMYLKDANFKYQAATKKMLHRLGVETIDQIIDKTNEEVEINLEIKDFLFKFEKQDILAQKNNECIIFLNILRLNGVLCPYVIYKTPIINPATNNFVGIRAQIMGLLLPNITKLLFKINGTKGLLINQKAVKDSFNEYNLSDMQHAVLFLSLNNYSYSKIALLISEFAKPIKPTLVNSYLEELKLIFHVRTKEQLIEKAIGLNFHVYLPNLLFQPGTINLTNDISSMIYNNPTI